MMVAFCYFKSFAEKNKNWGKNCESTTPQYDRAQALKMKRTNRCSHFSSSNIFSLHFGLIRRSRDMLRTISNSFSLLLDVFKLRTRNKFIQPRYRSEDKEEEISEPIREEKCVHVRP
jgi:hypothetical protein